MIKLNSANFRRGNPFLRQQINWVRKLNMKISDDYQAKLKIWASEGKVYALPKITNIPKFSPQKFNSYAEMNAWKSQIIKKLIRSGGAKWSR